MDRDAETRYTQTTVRMPDELLRRLRVQAKAERRSLAAQIQVMLEEQLNNEECKCAVA